MYAIIGFILGVFFGAFVLRRDFTLNVNKTTNNITPAPEPLTDIEIEAILKMEDEKSTKMGTHSQESLNSDGLFEALAALTTGSMEIEDLI